jgi:hypothetical protein
MSQAMKSNWAMISVALPTLFPAPYKHSLNFLLFYL